MIKRFALLAILCFPLVLQAQDNKWRIYPLLGVDMGGAVPFPLSDIPDGAKGTPKINPDLGLGLSYNLSEKWELGIELSYHVLAFSATADVRSQPFYYDNHQEIIYFSGHTKTDAELRFIEFPLVAVYDINSNWSFTPGIYYSRILEGTFNTSGTDGVTSSDKADTDNATLPGIANVTYNFNDYIDKWDAGIMAGFRYGLNQKVFIWSRLQVGLQEHF